MQSSAFFEKECAVALSLCAALAEPERCVAAFKGDEGFRIDVGELATAAEFGVQSVIVIR